MIKYSDIPKMTIRELCAMAEQVRSAPAGSKKAAELSLRIGAATTYLEDAGALQQMLWWVKSAEPEAPPMPSNVIQFPGSRPVN